MTTEEKLLHFQQSTMGIARDQSARMLAEHQEALDKIFAEQKEKKCRQAKLQIQLETERLHKENNKTLAHEQLSIKRMLTKHHNDLKEKLFVEVKNVLDDYMSTPAYDQYLIRHIKEAAAFADGREMIIYIDPADATKRRSLESATGVAVTISEYSFLGGMRAIITGRNILIDHSFASKLEEVKENFRFTGGHFHE